uniref:Uncharacterized protein n=1 Tax=Sciurus vulgaris TaxID=55149 RepID=A0A8D2AND3_SCIVU
EEEKEELFILLLNFVLVILNLFIITLSDLECDYISARSHFSKLNKWVIPELIGLTIVAVLMHVSLQWFLFLLNVQLLLEIYIS